MLRALDRANPGERTGSRRRPAKSHLAALVILAVFALGCLCAYLLAAALFVERERGGLTERAESFLPAAIEQYEAVVAVLLRGVTPGERLCDTDDLSWMREAVFQVVAIRDVGRVEDGLLRCTAISGRIDPVPLARSVAPDFADSNGIIWSTDVNLRLYDLPSALVLRTDQTTAVVRIGEFFDESYGSYGQYVVVRDPETDTVQYTSRGLVPLEEQRVERALRESGGKLLFQDGYGFVACGDDAVICIAFTDRNVLALERRQRQLLFASAFGGLMSVGLYFTLAWGHRRHMAIGARLRRAIERDELTLHYQPEFDLATREVIGCEALVRWFDKSGRAVPTEAFIAAAEEGGAITALTESVIATALREFGPLLRHDPNFKLAINVSAADVLRERFAPRLSKQVGEAGVEARQIILELTERSTGDTAEVAAALHRLKEAGFRIAIDDFGAGYSSLQYLQELQADYLKIDRSLTRRIGLDAIHGAITPAVIQLANDLGVAVIVEGLETEEQIRFCRDHGAQYGQGWAVAGAMPIGALTSWLDARKAGVTGE